MIGAIAFAVPGESGEGRAVHLPCGHDAVLPDGGSVMMLPTAVLEHLDHCEPPIEATRASLPFDP